MFAKAFFAKVYFTGYYFTPVDDGSAPSVTVIHSIGRLINMGTLLGRR